MVAQPPHFISDESGYVVRLSPRLLHDDQVLFDPALGVCGGDVQYALGDSRGRLTCDGIDLTGVSGGEQSVTLSSKGCASKTYTFDVPATECSGYVCAEACCARPDACQTGVCLLPDLTVDQEALASSVVLDTRDVVMGDCALVDQCVSGFGERRLLRFSVSTPNLGSADLVIGDPQNDPNEVPSQCHDRYCMAAWAGFALRTTGGELLGTGRKQALCLYDSLRIDPEARSVALYTCDFQGISAGWTDVYPAALDCQWIDVTDVPPGDYTLEVTVDPEGRFDELDETNNTASVPVSL
jgi:hypothetical protein